jgi:hypothetical protein
MGNLSATSPEPIRPIARQPRLRVIVFFLAATGLFTASCNRIIPVDTGALDSTGMSYDSIQQLKGLKINSTEVAELAKARHEGFSDAACVEVTQMFHARAQNFNAGDAIAGSLRTGFSENTIVELAKLNQLGLGIGELQAMRLAGLSDEIVLEVARHHADGRPVFSGASLAGMKNAGLSESTLLELARRGLPDSEAEAIVSLRHSGANDAEILRRFTSS